MRTTQFWEFVSNEFGTSYGRVLVDDLALPGVGGLTAREALESGVPTREVWLSLCEAADVPRSHWHGRDRPSPRAARAGASPTASWPAGWPKG